MVKLQKFTSECIVADYRLYGSDETRLTRVFC